MDSAAACDTMRLIRRSHSARGSSTFRSQVKQRMPMSAPIRTIRHVSPPHGCCFRICTVSPTLSAIGPGILHLAATVEARLDAHAESNVMEAPERPGSQR